MAAIDSINAAYDKAVIKPAVIHTPNGERKKWQGKSEFRSVSDSVSGKAALPENLRFQSHSEDFV